MADNKCLMCIDKKVVAAIGLKGQGYRPNFFLLHTTFLALHSQLGVCSNLTVSWQTSPKMFSTRVTYVIKLSKAYKASSNVLKEKVKISLSKEKYK